MPKRHFANPEQQQAYEQAFRRGEREGRLIGLAIRIDLEAQEWKEKHAKMTGINTALARAVLRKDKELRQDSKTGLLLYDPFFVEAATARIKQLAEREGDKKAHSLLLLDLDDFKVINELLGYTGADETCLKPTATIINNSVRPHEDLAGRFGGEEFVLFLPNTDQAGARIVAERIRARVNKISLTPSGSHHTETADEGLSRLGISIGIATLEPGGSYDLGFNQANDALKQAKGLEGKNQIVVWQPEE